ncbi:MAG: MerR family transcriptional regulator [Ktedonobacterales bacterium]
MSNEEANERGELSIEELAEATSVPVRTVRFYITEGLLPGPGSRGKAASYRQEHLARLRLIRLLVRQRLPLAEIGAVLARVSDAEVGDLLAREEQRAATLDQSAEATAPQAYIAALLENARAARADAMVTKAPTFRSRPRSPYGVRSRSGTEPPGRDELWHRIQLAPGVELQVSAAARGRYTALIERLRQVAEEEIHGEQ